MSALVASPAVEGRSPSDPVRALQHALYRAAKADPGRRFHSLRDKVYRRDVLWRAWVNVRRNNGAAGIDKTTLAMVEEYGVTRLLDEVADDLRDGGYRPSAARRVFIPKPGTTERRPLSIPTVADRIAQTVVALTLEPRTESVLHDDSYGYRPRRSALQAVQRCRQRCFRKNWVLDLDVAQFFDSVPHDLMVKAVAANTDQPWVLLYVERWLTAPLQRPDGTLQPRDRGTPQGSAVSPVLANLFMHYAFDLFLDREFPGVQFERYAYDAVVHCVTERQAQQVWDALAQRLESVGLRLHPDKTRIVYCKDDKRRGGYQHTSFTFLGFTFGPRAVLGRDGAMFTGFLPAASDAALKEMGRRVRQWRIHRHTGQDLTELAAWINPIVAGWMTYYGRFYRSRMYRLLRRINTYSMRWARQKYKRLRSFKASHVWWRGLIDREPALFRHWAWMREVEPGQG